MHKWLSVVFCPVDPFAAFRKRSWLVARRPARAGINRERARLRDWGDAPEVGSVSLNPGLALRNLKTASPNLEKVGILPGQTLPKLGTDRPTFGHVLPRFGQPCPRFGNAFPSFGHPFPTFGTACPSLGTVRPKVGHGFPRSGQERNDGSYPGIKDRLV